jgi:hypothetical protein
MLPVHKKSGKILRGVSNHNENNVGYWPKTPNSPTAGGKPPSAELALTGGIHRAAGRRGASHHETRGLEARDQ